jgi:hypothetical protein
MRRLHEVAQVPHNISKVRACAYEVPEATNDPPVLSGIDNRSSALLAQFQAGFHGCKHWIAALQALCSSSLLA